MKPVTSDNFGLLIAYLLPGFVTLWVLRPFVPDVAQLLDPPLGAGPTVGGFLYGTLGSVAAGLIVSAVRWAVVDHLYHRTGIPAPDWDFGKLPANLAAFDSHVQDHYRYYQFYALCRSLHNVHYADLRVMRSSIRLSLAASDR